MTDQAPTDLVQRIRDEVDPSAFEMVFADIDRELLEASFSALVPEPLKELFEMLDSGEYAFGEIPDQMLAVRMAYAELGDSLDERAKATIALITHRLLLHPDLEKVFLQIYGATASAWIEAMEDDFLASQLGAWLIARIDESPEAGEEVFRHIASAAQAWSNDQARNLGAHAPLDTIEERGLTETIDTVLQMISRFSEGWYKRYVFMLDDILVSCGHLQPHHGRTFGNASERVADVFEAKFPDHKHLIDREYFRIRNAFVHHDYELVLRGEEIVVLLRNRREGETTWEVELNIGMLTERLEAILGLCGLASPIFHAINGAFWTVVQRHLADFVASIVEPIREHREDIERALPELERKVRPV
jgi:hypothetical protein